MNGTADYMSDAICPESALPANVGQFSVITSVKHESDIADTRSDTIEHDPDFNTDDVTNAHVYVLPEGSDSPNNFASVQNGASTSSVGQLNNGNVVVPSMLSISPPSELDETQAPVSINQSPPEDVASVDEEVQPNYLLFDVASGSGVDDLNYSIPCASSAPPPDLSALVDASVFLENTTGEPLSKRGRPSSVPVMNNGVSPGTGGEPVMMPNTAGAQGMPPVPKKAKVPRPPKLLEPTRSSSRPRKKVEFWQPDQDFDRGNRPLEIMQGTGLRLADIPFVESQIVRSPVEDLKALHRLIFARAGTAHEVKRNLLLFSGFIFPVESETLEWEKKRRCLANMTMKLVKKICSVLDIRYESKKDDMIEDILAYLNKPFNTGRKPAMYVRRANYFITPLPQKVQKIGKKYYAKEGDVDDQDSSTSGEDDYDMDDMEMPPTKFTGASNSAYQLENGPSDDELRQAIDFCLKGADIETMTIKHILNQLGEKFPTIDMAARKEFVKNVVRSLISKQTPT